MGGYGDGAVYDSFGIQDPIEVKKWLDVADTQVYKVFGLQRIIDIEIECTEVTA